MLESLPIIVGWLVAAVLLSVGAVEVWRVIADAFERCACGHRRYEHADGGWYCRHEQADRLTCGCPYFTLPPAIPIGSREQRRRLRQQARKGVA